jgi:hypothetical protein
MPDLCSFIMGGFLGIASVAFAFDLRRKFTSAQQRERALQRAFDGLGSNCHE